MKVLVTGANGFLGRYVVAALRESGHAVRAMVLTGTDVSVLPEHGIELFEADLCSAENLADAFADVDVLIHLAAQLRGDDATRRRVTVRGTQRLLEAMAHSPTRRLILVSSFSVYDRKKACGVLTEQVPVQTERLHELDGYAIAKIEQEELVRRLSEKHAWSLIVLRPAAIWGNGNLQPPGMGRRLGPLWLVFAPRTPLRLCYAENAAQAFVKAVERPEAAGATLNLIDGEAVSAWRYTGEYLRRSGRFGLRLPVPYIVGVIVPALASGILRLLGAEPRLPGLLSLARFQARFGALRCPNDAICQTLAWRPRYSFAEALDRVFAQAPPQRCVELAGVPRD